MSQPRQNKMMSPNLAKQVGGDTTYTKIFVGGLAWETKKDSLKRYFDQFGEILEAVVITDRITGRSKGYGFVKPTYLLFLHLLFFLLIPFTLISFCLVFPRSPSGTPILQQGLVRIPILWLMEGELIVILQPLVPRNLIHLSQVCSFTISVLVLNLLANDYANLINIPCMQTILIVADKVSHFYSPAVAYSHFQMFQEDKNSVALHGIWHQSHCKAPPLIITNTYPTTLFPIQPTGVQFKRVRVSCFYTWQILSF